MSFFTQACHLLPAQFIYILEKLWNMSFRWKSIESIKPCSHNVEACLGITRNFIGKIGVCLFVFLLCYTTNLDFLLHHGTPLHLLYISLHIYAGYAFVYFEDEEDAKDAIRKLNNYPFGFPKRRLIVDWGKDEQGRSRDDGKANLRTKTLFVGQFDPFRTKEDDIKKHFEPYGKVINIRIRRNYSFVQFATQEDATKALEATQRSKILDRVLSIDYALKDYDERDDGGSPRRSRYDGKANLPTKTLFVRQLDPIRTKEDDIKKHFKPYGKVINVRIRRNYSFVHFATQEDATKALEATQRSKILDRVVSIEYALKDDDERDDGGSPRRSLSPVYRKRPSPGGWRGSRPVYDTYKGPTDSERRRSPSPYERSKSPPPYERRKRTAPYERRKRTTPYERRRSLSPHERRRSLSPYERRKSPTYGRYRSSPRRSLRPVYSTRPSPDYGCRGSPVYDSYKGPAGYERRRSPSPCERRKIPAPHERRRSLSPYEQRKSPTYGRYRSRSPVPRGR